ncbi:hypothetical protein SNARM312S_03053 [Streptomyces narbonensis]
MRSRPRSPAWPSLVWKTSGSGVPVSRVYVRTARDSADAEEHLLEEPVLAAAAVEPVGDVPFAGGVLLDVGVEHEQGYAADLGDPDVGVQAAPAGQGEGDPGGGAVGLTEQGDRELAGVEDGVLFLLPAVAAE